MSYHSFFFLPFVKEENTQTTDKKKKEMHKHKKGHGLV